MMSRFHVPIVQAMVGGNVLSWSEILTTCLGLSVMSFWSVGPCVGVSEGSGGEFPVIGVIGGIQQI